jgi:hypothetical protein
MRSGSAVLGSKIEIKAACGRERNGAREKRFLKMDTKMLESEQSNRHAPLWISLPFAPDRQTNPTLATHRSTPPVAFAHDHGR